jgi:valyl-tRNA synthetase
MSELQKAYEPQAVEEKWYSWWIERGHFTADPSSPKPAYSIVIPPPNVTGVLTLGHVLNNTLQDILARRARQTGHEVLWLPGTDHAGIATQTVVERKLRKEEKKTRHDLGRDEFLKRVKLAIGSLAEAAAYFAITAIHALGAREELKRPPPGQ